MTETHCFNIKVAKLYGVNCAIVLQNLWYWVQKNEKEGTNFHDGYYWTYNSKKILCEAFPYLSSKQIDYALKKLRDEKIIIVGNYNTAKYDRTLWYTITENGREYFQDDNLESFEKKQRVTTKGSNGLVQKGVMDYNQREQWISTKGDNPLNLHGQPIPNITTNITTNINTNKNIYSPAEPCSSEIKVIIDYLNSKLGTAYKASTKSTRSHILARLNEGYSLADFYKVIDTKYEEWGHDAKMSKFLCPDTLFGNKFEKYLNTASSKKKGSEYQSTSHVDISDLFD